MSKTTITAALPYANGPVHIGHLAGVYIPADIFARFMRNKGEEVLFICGSDEHGVPITLRAKKEGVTPQDVVDRYHGIIKDSFQKLGISFDIYSRTSSKTHKETAQDFFTKLHEKGVFQEISSEQFFDPETKQFLADRYITGDCPKCSAPGAYGDQCEKCGATLSPMELKNPKSALSGSVPESRETTNWYLPLDEIQKDFLEEYIESKKGDWRPTVYGQCKSWLNDGLRERAMTRDLDWGIPVPIKSAEGKVLYVWFEAPIGYISATRELIPESWEEWWTGNSELIHFIGKDNIVFHCIIFPAMLHLRGDGFITPSKVPANEFLNLEGQKISTSRNWAVWLNEYLEELPNRQDELRYVLTSIAPETKDSEFTWKDYQTRVNSELVGILGNFANRVLVLINKYYGGSIPTYDRKQEVSNLSTEYIKPVTDKLSSYKFRDAQTAFMELARMGNKFLADTEPWKQVKTNPKETENILGFAYEILSNIAICSEIFLPETYTKLTQSLNLDFTNSDKKSFWSDSKWYVPKSDNSIAEVELLFSKIEDETVEFQMEKLKNSVESTTTNQTQKEMITYEDFTKLDLTIAEVKDCKKVEKADRLLHLTLDVAGIEKTVLSGIAEHFSPEEVVGIQVLYLQNLAPRKIRGIESHGMILMAEDSDGKLRFMQPSEKVNSGAKVS
ncbi:MAG: methionine--tRNA ligase [Bacteroidia bacterium]